MFLSCCYLVEREAWYDGRPALHQRSIDLVDQRTNRLRTGGIDDEAPLPDVDPLNFAELECEYEQAEQDEKADKRMIRKKSAQGIV